MATAVIRRTLVAVLAVQPVSRSYGADTCGQEASPWTVGRNGSLKCGVSIEDDIPDDQVALLQTVLHVGNNGTKHIAPSIHPMRHGIHKSLFGSDVGENFSSLHGCFANNSFRHCLLSAISLPQTAARSVHSQQAKTAASVAAGPLFVIGAVCVGGVIVCMLIVNEISDDLDYRTSKDRAINPSQQNQRIQRKSPVPADRGFSDGAHGFTRESSGFGNPRDSHLPLKFIGASPVHEGYRQGLTPGAPAVTHGAAPAAAVVMGHQQTPVVVGPTVSMGHQQSPVVVGPTSPIAPGIMLAPSPPQQMLRSPSPPQGTDLASSERNLATRARDVFPGAGAPAICPSMILLNRDASLTIPMKEIIAAAAGGTEKLEIFSVQGKSMLQAKVQFDGGGRKEFVISSVKGGLPRVQIKPRGPGEPFDVIGPREVPYGTLVQTGDSSGILSHLNHPIMKINRVSNLDMTATAMDDSGIANAAPDGSNNWKLTVGKGADAVLICACMMGLILFGRHT